ncbi:hypothetical protein RD792_009072 [Penstemon davidsonii]|uniref:Flavin-containing monooxygenase n=1 Tax=Penstemon davidsonii TaxID=160366 RepID=A0ABR0DCG4_9LAMI|nr:hypothetical protein RD792_009072 [Penstemon davidsonii]
MMTIPIPAMPPPVSRTVAVIGAGAAGLSAALELRREGHNVVVYERETQLGGTWVYTPDTESDPIGLKPTREIVHSSLYASLRTNLPREVMGFRAYPFLSTGKSGRDPRRYPGHGEVFEYLKDFTAEFRISELVRFGIEVLHVGLMEDKKKWSVRSRMRNGGEGDDEIYDAVVICNGHYTEPRIAEIPGIDEWPGKQIHSHNYRVPEPFRDQVVVLIGSANSAADISRDIAKVAKQVHIASRSVQIELLGKLPGHDNIWLHPMIDGVRKDGTLAFEDGNEVIADVILHCTGSVVPFPLIEFQSKWIAGVLSGRISLPSYEEMMVDIEAFYSSMEASAIPKRYTHNMADYQFEYDDWLGGESGCPPTEVWRKQMYIEASRSKRILPETYRDQWEDEHLIAIAHQDFEQHITKASV